MCKALFRKDVLLFLLPLILWSGCKKGEPFDNAVPETQISIEAINLSGESRLNSLISLQWYGTDPDGFVDGFELSFNEVDWVFTRSLDSTFLFSIEAGSDTVDIDFWVRAIDDEGEADPTPAYLKIPLKNTPPEVQLNAALCPSDTAFRVVTINWSASDADGNQTIKTFDIRINDGEWVSIPPVVAGGKLRDVLTIVPNDPKAAGAVRATLYFDESSTGDDIDGLVLNARNEIYLRATDIANSTSEVDTLSGIFVEGQTEDLLVIGANSAQASAFLKSNLQLTGASFDYIDFVRENGKNQPRIWSPSLYLLWKSYDRVILSTSDGAYTNAQTNADDILLEFAASAIQLFTDAGGKMLITTALPNGFSTGSALFGILPIDSLSTSDGQARLPIDSLATGANGYPDLLCNQFISGLDPVYPSSDAEVIYTANLTRNNGWEGPENVGVVRRYNGNASLLFFSVELHKLNGDPSAVETLFNVILNDAWNW